MVIPHRCGISCEDGGVAGAQNGNGANGANGANGGSSGFQQFLWAIAVGAVALLGSILIMLNADNKDLASRVSHLEAIVALLQKSSEKADSSEKLFIALNLQITNVERAIDRQQQALDSLRSFKVPVEMQKK